MQATGGAVAFGLVAGGLVAAVKLERAGGGPPRDEELIDWRARHRVAIAWTWLQY